ncbi:MAG TPA: mechanosensitive ion channel domain-containing protein [Pyrinomonadaceae bacterium]|nr:mechanosensitive ion channel domain-containing protein [Pyrinomonadaceae bacterium]
MQELTFTADITVALSMLQDVSVFRRIWNFLTNPLFGNQPFTVMRLLGGIAVFVFAIFLSRRIGDLLERRIAKRTYIDPGLRYTIARLAGYLLIVAGVLAGLKMVGVDMTSVAVLFTALSVGIGFGLQYIAADIASGFILLFERPIRIGDRITIGEDEGDIKSINLRTTLVTTNDNISIIVPNSKLVSQRVINWSYGDPRARIAIPVGVAYDSNVELVTETLILAADGVENVLTDPAPRVQFLRFGDSSLDFRLLVWSVQPRRHFEIKSDINFRIWTLFRERGIEIPYPTTEFRMRPEPANSPTGEKDSSRRTV